MNGPKDNARRILAAWMHERSEETLFPIKCREIAEGFGIIVKGDHFEAGFQGGLFIQPGLKAILYNENIREDGRKNFTIAHELGHYFLHKDRKELRCSIDDLEDLAGVAPHAKAIEAEANSFAASLLMPASDIAAMTKDVAVDIGFIQLLADRYNTSITATACRATELIGSPMAIVMLDGRKVLWSYKNSSFSGFYAQRGSYIDSDPITSANAQPVLQQRWFPNLQYERWELFESACHLSYYGKTLVLIRGVKI